MILVKLGLPEEENIVSRNVFVANKIFPIAIRQLQQGGFYMILFVAYQDYDDSYLYFQMVVKPENAFDLTYLESSLLNIKQFDNIDLDKASLEMKKKYESYHNLISKIEANGSNVYNIDFNMKEDINKPFYYKAEAVRAIDRTHASIMEVYLPLHNFCRVRLYIDRLINPNPENIEDIFTNEKFHNIEMVNIETVKLDATHCAIMPGGELGTYITHYNMHCGPSEFKMNYAVILPLVRKPLKVGLDINLYNTFYSKDYNIENLFTDEENLFIFYEERSIIDGSFKKMKLLKLSKELADKTNFIDPYFIIDRRDEKEIIKNEKSNIE